MLALALLALGVAARLWIRWPTDFWEDEIIAASHAMQPFWRIILDCLRFDVHPPLYFMQLHLWALVSHSDLWLTLNSVAWGLAAIASLWWTARRLYDGQVALWAASVFAVLPSAVFMADQLRMYAMLAVLIIWLHYFATRNFSGPPPGRRALIAQALLGIAIIFSHAIGFVAVAVSALYALLIQDRPFSGTRLRAWAFIYGICALAALPWMAGDVLHDANIGEAGGLAGLATAMAHTILVPMDGEIVFYLGLGVLLFLAVTAVGFAARPGRAMALAYIAAPILLCVAVSLFFKPFFKWNFFSTLAAPYLALILALALGRPAGSAWSRLVALGCVVLLTAACVATRLSFRISSGYRDRAGLIAANLRPGDMIYAPQFSIFEGAAWYLAGPDWGSPLDIAEPPSGPWRKLYAWLGPQMVERLGLMPKAQLLERGRYRILVGNSSAPQAAGAARVWMLSVPRGDLRPGYPPPKLNGLPVQWSDHRHTWLTLYAASAQQVTVPGGRAAGEK